MVPIVLLAACAPQPGGLLVEPVPRSNPVSSLDTGGSCGWGPADTQLLVNGDFELGVTGWAEVRGTPMVVEDTTGASSHGGVGYLHGGIGATEDGVVDQDVDLLAAGFCEEDLDLSDWEVQLSGWLRTATPPATFDDQVLLRAVFLDAAGRELGSLATLIAEDEAWTFREARGLLPVGTRVVRVEVESRYREGPDCDGMADDLDLRLVPAAAADPVVTKAPMLQDASSTRMTLLWETDGNLAVPGIDLALSGDALAPLDVPIETTEVAPDAYVHRVTIEGLSPATAYDYRVRNGGTELGPWTFQTGPGGRGDVRIAWLADNQVGADVFRGLVPLVADKDPDLYFAAGDIVQNGDVREEWDWQWFSPLSQGDFAQTTPVLFARGNHDDEFAYAYAYSALPGNGSWYAFRYGKVYVVVLDTEAPTSGSGGPQDQLDYLQAVLASPAATTAMWRIVAFHRPPYTNLWKDSRYDGTQEVRDDWVSVFETYGVDLVVSGHAHAYQRGTLNGVTYVVSGGGGGTLDTHPSGSWSHISVEVSEHHYNVMTTRGNRLLWVAYDEGDAVIDRFTLTR